MTPAAPDAAPTGRSAPTLPRRADFLPRRGDPLGRALGYLALILGALAVVLPALRPASDADVWWHLRAGADLLAGRAGAFVEAWSFTAAGTPWVNHEWLAEVVLASMQRVGGGTAVVILVAVVMALTAGLLIRTAAREKVPFPVIGAALALTALAMDDRFVPRPQIFSYLLLAWTLERAGAVRRGLASPWIFPVIQLVWTNLHGPLIGLGTMSLVILGGGLPWRTSRERWLVLGAVGLASLVHPCGPRALLDYAGHLGAGGLYRQMVQEWQPILAATQRQLPERTAALAWSAIAALGAIVRVVRRPRLVRWGLTLLLLGLAVAPFVAVRHRDLLAVAALPALALLFGPVRSLPARARVIVRVVGLAATTGALVILIGGRGGYAPAWPPATQLDTTGFPVEATAFLKREAPPAAGRILNTYDFGGWLVHDLPPAWRIFIDGRYFVYGEELVAAYLGLRDAAPGSREQLLTRDVGWLVLRYPGADGYQALAGLARQWPEWALVHWDDQAVVYVRRDRVDAAWRERHEYRVVDPTLTTMPDDPGWWREHTKEIVRESWRAARAAPGSARPRFVLALAFERADRDGDAARWFGEVTRLFPGHRIARQGLQRIRDRHGGTLPDGLDDAGLRHEFGLEP